MARGTVPAIVTAIGAFLVYDFFFIEPLHTFTVRDPAEWLNLLLLLVVGIVVGRLAGRERDRAVAAIEGEREAPALFNISFTLATGSDASADFGRIAEIVRDESTANRVWITVGETVVGRHRRPVVPAAPSTPAVHVVLRRRPGDEPAEWVRVHAPPRAVRGRRGRERHGLSRGDHGGTATLGSIWATRSRELGRPGPR